MKRSRPRSLEERLAVVLGFGSMASLALMVAGFALLVGRHADASTAALVGETGASSIGASVILVGVALLIATPVCRVLVTLVASLRGHDRVFAVLNTMVLIIVGAALWLGHRSG